MPLAVAQAWPGPDISAPEPVNRNADVDTGGDYEPAQATDGAGRWIAVWHSGETLNGQLGIDFDILFARSADHGVTWSAPAPLNANAGSDSGSDWSPRIATDGAGTWIAVWSSLDDLGGTIGSDRDILLARSTDDGVTWGPPTPLDANAFGDVGGDWEPEIVTDGRGTWLTVWSSDEDLGGAVGTDDDVFVARSVDGGVTWSAPAVLNGNAAFDSGGDFFPHLAVDRDGNWVAAWFTPDPLDGTLGADRDILYARSLDGGVTWTAPVALNSNAASDVGVDAYPWVASDGADRWIVVWHSNDTLAGALGTDGDILCARSDDDGATWTAPAPVNADAATDVRDDGQPRMATDRSRWVVVWSAETEFGGAGTDSDSLLAWSRDAGATWSDPQPLNTNAMVDSGADALARVATDALGRWLAVWVSDDDLGGTIGNDPDVLVARFGFCDIRVEGHEPTEIHFEPSFPPAQFEVVVGLLSDLREGGDFDEATCLGSFLNGPALDPSPAPPVGDGVYYLARGVSVCAGRGYGTSSPDPDPRAELLSVCP